MALYRKISPRMYGDSRFCELSAPQPNGQTLWVYLLTGPFTTCIPGVIPVGEMALAESLEWPLKDFRKAFAEIESREMAMADWQSRLVFVPKAIAYNSPESPNVVLSWHSHWELVPECDLKNAAFERIMGSLSELGDAYASAWESSSVRHQNYKIHAEIAAQVKIRDQGKCRYCGTPVSWVDRKSKIAGTYDHVNPSGPGTLENVVVACRSCNSRKGFRTPERAGLVLIQIGPRSDLDQICESGTGTGTGTESRAESGTGITPPQARARQMQSASRATVLAKKTIERFNLGE